MKARCSPFRLLFVFLIGTITAIAEPILQHSNDDHHHYLSVVQEQQEQSLTTVNTKNALLLTRILQEENEAAATDATVSDNGQISTLEDNNATTDTIIEEEAEHADAVLFPSFCVTIGAVSYLLLTRIKILSHLPYTATMFIIGALMGIGATLSSSTDVLHESVKMWTSIESEVLLLVFLPGLIFKDAVELNVHLFRVSLLQNLIFAFPLVLAGSALTALVAYFIFPWSWSFNLCMTFGSILSATDPVSVAALLNELGAPPRLKTHISGEALLNDGAAIVFYSIFVLRYLYEMGVEGVGEDVDFARGVALFFRKSLGGVAAGLFFGFAILAMLKLFNRRFTREENVTEVSATLALAYVGYFCADYVWATSGVIATLAAGLTVKFLGRAIVNDEKLLQDFWQLLEHLLNTVLFTLGGVMWGSVLSEENSVFRAKEWGYLILLYILLTVIRTFLFIVIYPITTRIGLGTCWQETTFQVHAGLRGAVGIALALSLDSEVSHLAEGGEVDPIYPEQARQVFGFVGGIAFMTLVINAPTCKPLLAYLKLSESTETRSKIIDVYRARLSRHAIQDMVSLLSQPRFKDVSFSIIEKHVPFLSGVTKTQLAEAVERHRETTPQEDYQRPHLKGILPFVIDDTDGLGSAVLDALNAPRERKPRKRTRTRSTLRHMMREEPKDVQEFRYLFISILRSAYEMQISGGELSQRHFLTITLEQSLDLASDQVAKDEPLKDWDYISFVDPELIKINEDAKGCFQSLLSGIDYLRPGSRQRWKQSITRLAIDRALAFIAAHRYAQAYFTKEFENADSELSHAGQMVVLESMIQVDKAEEELRKQDKSDVELAVSHKFCSILLHSAVIYIEKFVAQGLLKDDEAEEWVREIEKEVDHVNECNRSHGIEFNPSERKDASFTDERGMPSP